MELLKHERPTSVGMKGVNTLTKAKKTDRQICSVRLHLHHIFPVWPQEHPTLSQAHNKNVLICTTVIIF